MIFHTLPGGSQEVLASGHGAVGMAERATGVQPEAGNAAGGRSNGHRPPAPARRRPLPGARAVVGGLLVAAAAVGLYAASSSASSGPRHSYVVARHGLAPGARLTPADLSRLPLDLPPALAQRAFRDTRTLEGATVVSPLAAGELVQASAVVAKSSAPGSREITFTVPRATLAPTLEQGERIDVVATFGTGVDAFSSVVLRHALVVGLDRGRERVGAGDDAAVTVAVDDPGEAVSLAHAIQLGRLTVVRTTGATPAGASDTGFRQAAPTGGGRP